MCGIIGYVGNNNCVPYIIDGLKKLEYRGYDSAGLAVLQNGNLVTVRAVGKVAELEKATLIANPKGTTGIGHTRWATHGKPSEENSHPHTDCTGDIVVVHNGIIENYLTLRAKLEARGHRFKSETDTEVIAHLIEENLLHVRASHDQDRLLKAVQKTNKEISGAYAYGVMWARTPGLLIGVKKQSPMVVGVGKDENFLASDVPAFLKHTNKVLFLEEGDVAVLHVDGVTVLDKDGKEKKVKPVKISWDQKTAEKGGYAHFMLKEIYDQPQAIEDTLRTARTDFGKILGLDTDGLRQLRNIHIIACGTAYHAGLVGKYYIEQLAGIPVSVDLASEYKYRTVPQLPNTLAIAISQSGETADTIGAIKKAKDLGFRTLAICNVLGSSLTRTCDSTFFTHCGPEISVASTKAFTSQITSMYALAAFLGQANGNLSQTAFEKLYKELLALSKDMGEAVKLEYEVRHLTRKIYKADRFIFLGRNVNFPIALEGALKLKEVSYRSAEGFAAGEIKHGPISIIDKGTPVIVLMPHDALFEKMLSACQECRARGAFVVAVTTKAGAKLAADVADQVFIVPQTNELLQPVLDVVPLQFLAYWIAKRLGCDIDQPRNLAKSVTVE
ncbi:MAG: glutamine--fructose-6-phosphate transaminase (isomerizing) [Spirochaetia bacterium]|uniref:glutamine--fructose-6-phosphate transaminase (isomerizing) n=1 Tax=Candidatus Avelusimicrobium fimicolum TaxID=3416216 RepID=UPI003CB1232E|nr:glutamine--fructose-6-phosphate transaminase (isomerizing) [Spirochaetia bacterium]